MISVLTVTALISSSAMAGPPADAPAFQRVSDIADQVAIVPIHDGGFRMLQILCGQSGATGFTPTQEEVRRAEAGLVAYLQKSAPKRAEMVWQKSSDYRRQYGGVIVGKGRDARRKLIMNASCSGSSQDWLRQVVAVKDGGSCYYQLSFDLTSGTFSDLRINGEG